MCQSLAAIAAYLWVSIHTGTHMKHFLIAGLLAAIGAVALVGPAHASSYCFYNPDDPDCYDQGGNGDGGYTPPPPPPPRYHFYGDDQGDQYNQDDQGGDGYYQQQRPRYQLVSRCAAVGQSLRRYGYRHIRPLDCGGKNFKYEAFRGYQRFIVKVKASNGRVLYVIQG